MEGILDMNEDVNYQWSYRGGRLLSEVAFAVRQRQGNMRTDPTRLVSLTHIDDWQALQIDSMHIPNGP